MFTEFDGTKLAASSVLNRPTLSKTDGGYPEINLTVFSGAFCQASVFRFFSLKTKTNIRIQSAEIKSFSFQRCLLQSDEWRNKKYAFNADWFTFIYFMNHYLEEPRKKPSTQISFRRSYLT